MHIFKNVASTLWDHLIGARDSVNVREDLRNIGRMRQAWPRIGLRGKIELPRAPWMLLKTEEKMVKQQICSFRTPTGHMRCLKGAFIKKKKRGVERISGLKSHDWHKMIQVKIFML